MMGYMPTYDYDIHSASRGNSKFIREYLWNWCHYNLRGGFGNGLRVRCREDHDNIKVWIDYAVYPKMDLELVMEFGEPMEAFLERVKATYMLLGG